MTNVVSNGQTQALESDAMGQSPHSVTHTQQGDTGKLLDILEPKFPLIRMLVIEIPARTF